jgi:hypothetical protein
MMRSRLSAAGLPCAGERIAFKSQRRNSETIESMLLNIGSVEHQDEVLRAGS